MPTASATFTLIEREPHAAVLCIDVAFTLAQDSNTMQQRQSGRASDCDRRHFLVLAATAMRAVSLAALTACVGSRTAPLPTAPSVPTASVLAPTTRPIVAATLESLATPESPLNTASAPVAVPTAAPATPSPTALAAPTVVPGPLASATPSPAAKPEYLSWANPGPYRQPGWTDFRLHSFSGTQGIVLAYFFNFYRYATYQSEVQAKGGDFFPLHPTDLARTDFASQAWYEQQFGDMVDAGIDVVLYNYWGEPGQYAKRVAPAPERNLFSTQGIPPMVAALQAVAARGTPLKVGLFLDTTIMNDEDLTTERGKQIFFATIRDYYSRIPPTLWAAIDSRPVIWLYDAQKVAAFDQSTFDYVYDHFAQDFGGSRPYIVREVQWYTAKNTPTSEVLRTEGVFAWGAAPFGFNADPRFTVADVGPGFNNALFTNRFHGQPGGVITDRRGGQYYTENLEKALASGRRLLAIETWNELCEASGIQETVEHGRQYIALTRRYADRLKAKYPVTPAERSPTPTR